MVITLDSSSKRSDAISISIQTWRNQSLEAHQRILQLEKNVVSKASKLSDFEIENFRTYEKEFAVLLERSKDKVFKKAANRSAKLGDNNAVDKVNNRAAALLAERMAAFGVKTTLGSPTATIDTSSLRPHQTIQQIEAVKEKDLFMLSEIENRYNLWSSKIRLTIQSQYSQLGNPNIDLKQRITSELVIKSKFAIDLCDELENMKSQFLNSLPHPINNVSSGKNVQIKDSSIEKLRVKQQLTHSSQALVTSNTLTVSETSPSSFKIEKGNVELQKEKQVTRKPLDQDGTSHLVQITPYERVSAREMPFQPLNSKPVPIQVVSNQPSRESKPEAAALHRPGLPSNLLNSLKKTPLEEIATDKSSTRVVINQPSRESKPEAAALHRPGLPSNLLNSLKKGPCHDNVQKFPASDFAPSQPFSFITPFISPDLLKRSDSAAQKSILNDRPVSSGVADPSYNPFASEQQQPGISSLATDSVGTPTFKTVIVDFDYTKSGDQDITAEVGEHLQVEKEEEEWLFCRKDNGDVGWIPRSFTRDSDTSPATLRLQSPIQEADPELDRLAEVLFAFDARNNDELSCPAGATVKILSTADEDWWLVEYESKQGFIPSNFLNEFSEIEACKDIDRATSPNPFTSSNMLFTPSATEFPTILNAEHETQVDLRPENQNRLEAIKELIKTEQSYVNDLELVKSYFLTPLSQMQIDMHQLFSNFLEIADVNSTILSEFLDTSHSGEALGSVFLRHLDSLQCYKIYCQNLEAALSYLQRVRISNPKLGLLLKSLQNQPACKHLDLSSYLLIPMQRATRYPLLFRQILHYTSKDHLEYDATLIALQLSEEFLDQVNNSIKETQTVSNIKRIVNTVDLDVPNEVGDFE
jgi:hypothetical protein